MLRVVQGFRVAVNNHIILKEKKKKSSNLISIYLQMYFFQTLQAKLCVKNKEGGGAFNSMQEFISGVDCIQDIQYANAASNSAPLIE